MTAGGDPTLAIDLPDVAATGRLGRQLAAALPPDTSGWMILLQGDLGSGKSTLARAVLRGLGFEGTVPSPTYTLVEPYDLPARRVYHVDLYRISSESELPFLGWAELRDGLMLVEWPERVPGLRRQADLAIRLEYSGGGRAAVITAMSGRAADLTAPPRFCGQGPAES